MAKSASCFDGLFRAFRLFEDTLAATTVPTPGGGRRVDGMSHAVALSEAASRLEHWLRSAEAELFKTHGQPLRDFPTGIVVMGADSPDGPWEAIPASEVQIVTARIGRGGVDAVLVSAFDSATRVVGFPLERWNALQAANPGAKHQRYFAGDSISEADLGVLRSAQQLLTLHEQRTRTAWIDPSSDELDGTSPDLSGERRSLCNAVKSTVSAALEAVKAQLRVFQTLTPEDRRTVPTFDSPEARAVAVFRLLEIAQASGEEVSHLLPAGMVFDTPEWMPGDDSAAAAPFMEKCAAWMHLAKLACADSLPSEQSKGAMKKKRKRKSPLNPQPRKMTQLELNTLEVVGRHKRNFAAAAAELRKDPKTVRENYDRALSKSQEHAGRTSRSVNAGRLPEDRRGQPHF